MIVSKFESDTKRLPSDLKTGYYVGERRVTKSVNDRHYIWSKAPGASVRFLESIASHPNLFPPLPLELRLMINEYQS